MNLKLDETIEDEYENPDVIMTPSGQWMDNKTKKTCTAFTSYSKPPALKYTGTKACDDYEEAIGSTRI